jgi:ABC-type multidrug transport system fused ATPase/permease subunit
MDVFANISLDTFKILTWTLALSIGALWFLISAHKRYWDMIASALLSLLVTAAVFLLANLGVAFYILSHMTDPRWSAGKEPLWKPSELESNLPFIDEVVKMLNGVQDNVSGAVNNVGTIQNAIFATGDFLWMVVLSIGAVIVLAICTFVASRWAKRRNDKEQVKIVSQLRAETEDNRKNLEDIRRATNLPPFQKPVK